MSNIAMTYNEKDLFVFLQKIRLDTAKHLNELNIEKSKNIKEDKPTAKGFVNNAKNFFERNLKKYDQKDEYINKDLESFNNNHNAVISESTARCLIISLFNEDKYGLAKLLFASTVILDDDYNYRYVDEGLEEVSNILYGNRYELLIIKKQLETNYNAISPKKLSNLQKGLLLGVAATALVGVISMPILLGAGATASAAATTAALAAHGFGDMQIGLAVFTTESLLLGAAVVGITYGGMKLYNSQEVKKEFLNLSPEKNALYLALQCTYIERIKKSLEYYEFKEQLDSILKNMNVLKSDLDYYLFVEKESVENNKNKIKSFHNFDNRLMKVMDI